MKIFKIERYSTPLKYNFNVVYFRQPIVKTVTTIFTAICIKYCNKHIALTVRSHEDVDPVFA